MNNDNDFNFLKLETNHQNLIYSPLSIRNGLALLSAGANGATKAEIDAVLGDAEIPKYQNDNKTSLANAIFIRDTFKDKVLSSYTDLIRDKYGGEVIYDNFASNEKMNNWVSEKTFKLIDSIGIESSSELRMVLANALAIKMDWKYKFRTDKTYGMNFVKQDGTNIEATMMQNQYYNEDMKYFADEKMKSITLPLASSSNTELEFSAIMPSGNLNEYINNTSISDINAILDNSISAATPEHGVKLFIPKFKFDYKLDFENNLKTMGIQAAFNSDSADFSKMASFPLYINKAVHKANIDFSEDGIKAAAVTAFAMREAAIANYGPRPQPITIKINRPFLFVIRDRENGAIWFTGTVYEPNSWKNDMKEYRPGYDY
jgi:serpin B